MNHLVWIFPVLLVSLCNAQTRKRQASSADYDEVVNFNQGGEVFDADPLLFLNLGGSPGIDFPMYRKIPKTSFSCKKVKASGYYADMETNCQVFHLCENGRKLSFLCPNGTIFRQSRMTCDWWYKVDCGASLEFYESSAEQLRQDRNTPRSGQNQPLNFDDKPVPVLSKSKSNSLESQEVAETGSLIINLAKNQKNKAANGTTETEAGRSLFKLNKPRPNTTPANFGTKKSIYVPTVPSITSKATTTAAPVTTTEILTTTFEATTFSDYDQIANSESLQGSHSSWFNSPTTQPPVTEPQSISELVNTLQNVRRSDEGRAGRAQRLEDVPLVARPQTLHSLATYFAADNKTRQELDKVVPEDQKLLMQSIMREQKQQNSKLNTSNPDLRHLAKIFSKALTDYLHDPETFRESLNAVHPTPPPLPLVSDNLLLDEDKDEVLDFSDAPQTKPFRPTTTTTTPEPPTTAAFEDPVTNRRNDVASKVNEIQQEYLSARRFPDGASFVTPTDFTSPDVDERTYLPNTPEVAAANLVDAIPTPSSFPISPEKIPFTSPEFYPNARDYVEIGFQPSLARTPTGRSYFDPLQVPQVDFHPPQYDINQFVPSDLNSLSILNIETRPSPTQPPVSVSVHIPKGIDHRVTIVSSPQNIHVSNQPSVTQNRPMISKLLFPLPSESLVSEGTASFPNSFRSAKSKQLVENSIDGVSKYVSQSIPAPTTPATTVEPITEFIPSTTEVPTTLPPSTTTEAVTTTEVVPRARKVDDGSDDSKLVLLLVKNAATTPGPSTPFISKTMLIEALLKSQQEKNNQVDVPKVGVSYATVPSTTPIFQRLVSSTPEATTYRSAKHAEILQKIKEEIEKKERESSTEQAVVVEDLSGDASSGRTARKSSLNHSDSRALDILKSLYSLATRWI
ncbi:mucin-2-like [Neocloeon triangulifer]|uniref:mucin-2-like n=1 Tax=Neocloeon triangulifer TaxID=2078957 RepID=UPI00286FAB49|nr:mucin-2-like [Neocloeon triangulifer]